MIDRELPEMPEWNNKWVKFLIVALVLLTILIGLVAILGVPGSDEPVEPTANQTDTDTDDENIDLTVEIVTDESTVDIEEQITLEAATTPNEGIESYEWSFGDGETAADSVETHAYDEDGTYDVTVTVEHESGETAEDTHRIDVEGVDLTEEPYCDEDTELNGDGTEESPYEVENVHDLQCIEDELDAHYELVDNINASYVSQWDDYFTPIGDGDSEFAGHFDGQGYEVNDLLIEDENEWGSDGVSLFGTTSKDAVITNVHVDGQISGTYHVGGIVGYNNGEVSDVTAEVKINAEGRSGGLIGTNGGDGSISAGHANSEVTAKIGGSGYIGGLVGYNYGAISDSTSSSNVVVDVDEDMRDSTRIYVHGLLAYSDTNSVVTNSYWNTDATIELDGEDISEESFSRTHDTDHEDVEGLSEDEFSELE